MAEVDENVMAFVEEALNRDPNIQLEELFQQAKNVSASIRDLSRRQFNARYPLQVKRRRSQAARKGAGKATRTPGHSRSRSRKSPRIGDSQSRDEVRGVFLQFATDIAGAEERKDLVKVLANVDHYVDQVFKGIS